MPKDLRSYLADVHREVPDELVCIDREVNPAGYDCTAIIKHLDAAKKFPVVVFERPLDLHGAVSPVKLMLNAEISQSKAQIALGCRVPCLAWRWPRSVSIARSAPSSPSL